MLSASFRRNQETPRHSPYQPAAFFLGRSEWTAESVGELELTNGKENGAGAFGRPR
ncbi:unnamed protein product [Arabidopsis lyrata]|nr:unnamed protein product [Arabidopsis lyrata]